MSQPKPAFDEIYREYSPKVFRVCLGYVSDQAQAQDLTQETFIAVWQHLGNFRGDSGIGTWIFRIATNMCLRAVERNRRMETAPFPKDVTAGDEVHNESRVALMHKAISELDSLERIIISLVLEGVAHSEIAEITGLSAVNVRVKAHRIREKLTKKLKHHGTY